MAERKRQVVDVNRAPVMTLWATVVAERLGHDHAEALSLGRAVAGLNAHSKAKRLGLARPDQDDKPRQRVASQAVPLLGRTVPVVQTDQGVRAVAGERAVMPASVEGYLRRSFGDDLERVEAAMQKLAASRRPDDLQEHAYELYERFRPGVPAGRQGWGVKGKLDLSLVRSLAKTPGK